jgi:hypothetical protein
MHLGSLGLRPNYTLTTPFSHKQRIRPKEQTHPYHFRKMSIIGMMQTPNRALFQ